MTILAPFIGRSLRTRVPSLLAPHRSYHFALGSGLISTRTDTRCRRMTPDLLILEKPDDSVYSGASHARRSGGAARPGRRAAPRPGQPHARLQPRATSSSRPRPRLVGEFDQSTAVAACVSTRRILEVRRIRGPGGSRRPPGNRSGGRPRRRWDSCRLVRRGRSFPGRGRRAGQTLVGQGWRRVGGAPRACTHM